MLTRLAVALIMTCWHPTKLPHLATLSTKSIAQGFGAVLGWAVYKHVRPARITSRPWFSDKYCQEVVNMMARGRDSPAQMLHHSHDLRCMFKEICSELQPNQRALTNLRAAKHRFESFQKPLGRTVRLFSCVHSLMVKVAIGRNDAQGGRARGWLEWLSARNVLMAAMLADAADEASALLRFCDDEQMDSAKLNSHIYTFLRRVTDLFGEKQLCLQCPGYTTYCLEYLQQPLVWVVRGKVASLAAPTADDIGFCMSHMRMWLKLADAELRCEFPDFEVAQAEQIQFRYMC